jgi:hypothetical protein
LNKIKKSNINKSNARFPKLVQENSAMLISDEDLDNKLRSKSTLKEALASISKGQMRKRNAF